MKKPATATRRNRTVRCAIYTRKSSEEGLEQEFNSLQAQREACEAFITSQRHEGWVCLTKGYNDGGFSGARMDRPALQRLLADLTAGRVDTIVVYKIDRLTRSLADFAKIVEILDARGASFVSVTQQFNTTTSMGRLTLNVLLSFAQFERGALYLMLQNRIYRGEIVHKEQSHPGEHTPIIDRPLWDAVQARLASNAAERNSSTRHRQPSLLAGLLFDGGGNRMTPSHAVKKGTRYRYYVSGSLITKDRTGNAAALRIPAAEIEQLVSDRVHRWLLDAASIDKSTAARFADPSIPHRRVARAAEIGKHWSELPVARKRAVLT